MLTTTNADIDRTDDVWETELVDLEAYFARIGYGGPHTATPDTLRTLHRAHLKEIGFLADGIDIEHLPIDISSVQEKLVRGGEGGTCYEHNLLFAAVLARLGFGVSRYLARVRRGNTTDIRFRSHTLLVVEAEGGERFLADVGFGDEGPLEPIAFQDGATSTVGGWMWSIVAEGDEWVLRSMHEDGWFDVYAFTTEPQSLIDFEVATYFSATGPSSVFRGRIVAMRVGPETRHVLRDRVLEVRYPDFTYDRCILPVDQIVATLREVFGLTIPEEQAAKVTAHLSRSTSGQK